MKNLDSLGAFILEMGLVCDLLSSLGRMGGPIGIKKSFMQ